MFKKLLMLGALLGLLMGSVQAETYIFIGGQMLVGGGDTKSMGGGFLGGIGHSLSPQVTVWGNVESFKTGEGVDADKWLTGISVQSEYLIDPLRTGIYGWFEGGGGKVEGEKVEFANLSMLGFYSDVKENITLWTGIGYSNIGKLNTYAIQMGLSWGLK